LRLAESFGSSSSSFSCSYFLASSLGAAGSG
jgi:hypothetical protein